MKIGVAQINYHIGNFEGNLRSILDHIQRAKKDEVDLLCFSELAVCGYPPRDFLEFNDFIRLGLESIETIRLATEGIAVVVGAPSVNPKIEGKDLFNSAYLIADRKILHTQHKTLLPTYDIFDEYRYFEPATEFQVAEYKGVRIALTVCEDIWNIGNENPLYTTCPMDHLIQQSPDLIVNVSASPFSYDQASVRKDIIRANVMRYGIPLVYVNHVGAQTELIFDGGSVVMSPNGQVFEELPYFEEAYHTCHLHEIIQHPHSHEQNCSKYELIHDALVLGVRDYFKKLNFRSCILGLSGGIDSAVTAVLAQRALGADNVEVLLMPSQFSSDHSVEDALKLSDNLSISHHRIGIESIYNGFLNKLDPFFANTSFGIAEENIQARIRGVLLMAFSNKFGHIVLNTSNKSEAAVGYGTLYGDMCGGLSVIGDVYKTEVYELAEYINRDEEIIPLNIIRKPPSAELRPDQKDSDSLPPYEDLDRILFEYIEERKGPGEIVHMGYDEALVSRILKLVNINEFKRFQTAPTLRVSSKAFGMGRRMPIVGKYLS